MTDANTTLPDELNPEYAFQTMPTALLIRLISNPSEAIEAFSKTLACRGKDLTGEWVGFPVAEKLHDERMAKTPTQGVLRQVPHKLTLIALEQFKAYDPCHIYAEMLGEHSETKINKMNRNELIKAMSIAAETIDMVGEGESESRVQAYGLIR